MVQYFGFRLETENCGLHSLLVCLRCLLVCVVRARVLFRVPARAGWATRLLCVRPRPAPSADLMFGAAAMLCRFYSGWLGLVWGGPRLRQAGGRRRPWRSPGVGWEGRGEKSSKIGVAGFSIFETKSACLGVNSGADDLPRHDV